MEILVPRASQYLTSSNCLRKGNLRAPLRQHRYYSIYRRIGGSTSHSECGLGQAGGIQITRSWPVRQPRGYATHGQGSRPTYAIVVTVTASCRQCQSTAHFGSQSQIGEYPGPANNHGDTGDGLYTYRTSSTRTTIRFYFLRPFLPAGVSWICQPLVCGESTFLADRDAVQEMAERLETPSSQTRNIRETAGKSRHLVEQPT